MSYEIKDGYLGNIEAVKILDEDHFNPDETYVTFSDRDGFFSLDELSTMIYMEDRDRFYGDLYRFLLDREDYLPYGFAQDLFDIYESHLADEWDMDLDEFQDDDLFT